MKKSMGIGIKIALHSEKKHGLIPYSLNMVYLYCMIVKEWKERCAYTRYKLQFNLI